MKKGFYITLFFIIAIIGYFWFGYANIYNRIRAGGLKTVDTQYIYTFNMGSQEIKYAALGDSLTAGVGTDNYEESYPYLLSKDLSKDNSIILKDFSLLGARTEDVIDKGLLEGVIEDKPDIITLLVGVNDVRENISEKEFESNYTYIINELVKNTNAKIYLINIPFIGSNTLYLPPYNWYFTDKTVKFNRIIRKIASDNHLTYINIASPTKQMFEKDGSYYSVDSLHPSKEGYKILEQIIYHGINH